MRVELHDELKHSQSLSASRVIVYDDYDNPIAVVMKIAGGQYVASTITQKQFPKILQAMGITKTTIVEHIDPKRLPPLD
jgi:hypothetical protein